MNCLETVASFLRGVIWSSLERFLQGFSQNNFPLLGGLKLSSLTVVTPTLATNEAPTRSLTRSTTSYDIYFKSDYSVLVRYPQYRLPISILLILGTVLLTILAAKRKSNRGTGTRPRRIKKKNRNEIVDKTNYDSLEEKPYNFFNPGKSSRINSLSGYCWNVGPKISSCQADIEETTDARLDCTINKYCHSVDYDKYESSSTSLVAELQMKKISVEEYLEVMLDESEDDEDGPENAYTQCVAMSKLNRFELQSKVKAEIVLICLNSNETEVHQAIDVLRTLISYEPVNALEDKDSPSMSEIYLKELKTALPRILQVLTLYAPYKIPIVLLLRDYFLYSKNREIEVRQFNECILFFFEFLKLCDDPSGNKLASKAFLQVLTAIEEDMFNVTIPIVCKSLKTEKPENYHCFLPILRGLKISLAVSEKEESRILALKSVRIIIRKVIRTSKSLDAEFLSELNEVFRVCQSVEYLDHEAKLRLILSDIKEALEYIKSKSSDREREISTSNEI